MTSLLLSHTGAPDSVHTLPPSKHLDQRTRLPSLYRELCSWLWDRFLKTIFLSCKWLSHCLEIKLTSNRQLERDKSPGTFSFPWLAVSRMRMEQGSFQNFTVQYDSHTGYWILQMWLSKLRCAISVKYAPNFEDLYNEEWKHLINFLNIYYKLKW